MDLFKSQTSLDHFLASAVFVIGILCDSSALKSNKALSDAYRAEVAAELNEISEKIKASGLTTKLRFLVLYVPLADKEALVNEFDRRLKAFQ